MSKSRRGGHAQWAVVAGASSGFGSTFAEQLAKRGLSPVLTGRDESRLAAVRARIGKLAPDRLSGTGRLIGMNAGISPGWASALITKRMLRHASAQQPA